MIELLLEIKKRVDEQKQVSGALDPGEINDFERRYLDIIAQGYRENPPPEPAKKRGRRKQGRQRNMLNRLSLHHHEILAFMAKFDKARCASCPLVDSCIFKEQKKFNAVTITEKKLIADRYRSLLGTAEHQALGDFRAGVEGVPSVLRRVYGIDDLPVRGLTRSRIWDHFKTIAYNFRSFYSYYKRKRANILSLTYFLRMLSQHYQFGWAMTCYC